MAPNGCLFLIKALKLWQQSETLPMLALDPRRLVEIGDGDAFAQHTHGMIYDARTAPPEPQRVN